MAPQDEQYEMTDGHMDELVRSAVRTDTRVKSMRDMAPDPIKTVRKQVVRHVDVPVETTVKVPVEKHVVKPNVARHTVKGKELVPVTKYREVEETHVEVQEELVKGERQVWKLVTEPYQETVKVPVEVSKTRKVPYKEYVPRTVEKVVEVPVHEISTVKGHRYDTHVGKKTIEVEQEEHYEVYPVFKKTGPSQVRELPASRGYVGRVERGRTQIPVRELPGELITSTADYSRGHGAEAGATMRSTGGLTVKTEKRSGERRRPASSASDPRLVQTARGESRNAAGERPMRSVRSTRDLERTFGTTMDGTLERTQDRRLDRGKSGGCSDAGSVCTQSTASSRRALSKPQQWAAGKEPGSRAAYKLDEGGVRDKITGPPTIRLREIVY